MASKDDIAPVRMLPEDLANKIAAGEVVERPASVVKELVENALDARSTRIVVRLVGGGRRTIEVIDNGHGMSEQDALLALDRHATSKIRRVQDLDNIVTLGFRGEALPSIASVARMEVVTRRAQDESGTRIRIDGGVQTGVGEVAAPVGTRVTVNHLYFNTPVRAKFLKGPATELGHCIDVVQRHALAAAGVAFELSHNDKVLLRIPAHALLRERVACIWGLSFANEMVEVEGEQAGFRIRGVVGRPGITRAARSHQFIFINRRPIMNRSMQYGFQDAYRGLVTVGRHPAGVLLVETSPRVVDVNIHPTKREVRFRDERAAHDAIRDVVRARLDTLEEPMFVTEEYAEEPPTRPPFPKPEPATEVEPVFEPQAEGHPSEQRPSEPPKAKPIASSEQIELRGTRGFRHVEGPEPAPMYEPVASVRDAPIQVFGTYLLVPEEDRLLIVDQHALHERLNYDALLAELGESHYAAQQLAIPIVFDVAPAQVELLESNLDLFRSLGIDIEPFGDNTFQVTAVCHLYDDSRIADAVYRVLDEVAQGDLFDKEDFMSDLLRLTVDACHASVKAGDPLTPQERRGLLEGFRQLRPPYTCPHGRPIITEITQLQMEKSFKRRQ
ncbi:MAG TPA: DNA mismatch repair endonuclease MutL [Candidatus Hydrogenedentes bacterium]|nr:DNA mismatch repair endonuclease MutL [Candidatus Hydrogenedentota bacterium]